MLQLTAALHVLQDLLLISTGTVLLCCSLLLHELSGVPMVPIDVTLVVVVVEGSFLEECLCRGSPHPACFNGERDKGDMVLLVHVPVPRYR
eukprot:COSAG05_NODE_4358_length_1550_cov_26.463818_1_plen_91_part_00